MRILSFLLSFIIVSNLANAQSETHNFITYDTTITIQTGGQWSTPDVWVVRISRPSNDTSSRPAIITMPGQGEQGSLTLATAGVLSYGPHYWLNNGWDGSVVLGNGVHYPILITVSYANNVYPDAVAYYKILVILINTFHIKRNSVYLGGLSQGAFTGGALIKYEQTAGDETGMKLIKAMAMFEGEPGQLPAPYNTWDRGTVAYGVWASKYGGRYFYLEGSWSDNFRNGWVWANAMNAVVPNSAYFSYEKIANGGHGGWNSMYDPKATNWTSVGVLGPNNAPSQLGTNQMGNYKSPSNVFQWMLRQGDTTLVGSAPVVVIPPVVPPKCPVPPYPVGLSVICENKVCIGTVYMSDSTMKTVPVP